MRAFRSVAVIGCTVLVASFSPVPPPAHASHCSTLVATLSGSSLNGSVPSGRGDWRGTPACTGVDLKVEVRDVNLPDGTRLTLDTCGLVAEIPLKQRTGKIELRNSAPTCTVGNPVAVRHGDVTVVSGSWCNPLFAKC